MAGPAQPRITATEARQIAVEWVTSSSRPLAIVEDESLDKLFTLEVRKMMLGRNTVSRDVARMLNVIK
ncbi:hypothetical protein V8E36_002950 [Tilletia maclaganii]